MTPEQLFEAFKAMSPEKREAFMRTAAEPLRKFLTAIHDQRTPMIAAINSMSPEERAKFDETAREIVLRGDGDLVAAMDSIYNPSQEQEDQRLTDLKNAIYVAYQQVTGTQMPETMVATMIEAGSIDALRQFMSDMSEIDPNGKEVVNATIRLTNGEIRNLGEDERLLTQKDDGTFVDSETGEPVLSPGADEQTLDGSAPPPPLDDFTPSLIGDPPQGFVPGVGFQDERYETEEQRQAEIDQALGRIEKVRRGTEMTPGSLVAGKRNLAHEIDDLNTFTDGGTMEARYYEGEQWQFSWQSSSAIRILQSRLEQSGLLKPKKYIPGMWDPTSAAAMRSLMLESNATGITWEMQLGRRLEYMTDELLQQINGTASSGRAPFVAPAYMRPDQASLSQAVKAMVRGQLRREPSAAEMAQLVEQMYGDYKAEYDAEVSALRSEYDATTAALDTGASQSAGTVQSVDPTNRFREAFESHFASEIELNEDSDEWLERSARMQGAMNSLDRAIGF